MKPEMKVQLAGIELANPVLAASGTFGYGIEFEEIVSLERLAASSPRASRWSPCRATRRPASSRPQRA